MNNCSQQQPNSGRIWMRLTSLMTGLSALFFMSQRRQWCMPHPTTCMCFIYQRNIITWNNSTITKVSQTIIPYSSLNSMPSCPAPQDGRLLRITPLYPTAHSQTLGCHAHLHNSSHSTQPSKHRIFRRIPRWSMNFFCLLSKIFRNSFCHFCLFPKRPLPPAI